MTLLTWHHEGTLVSAASCMHDDGDPFHYTFRALPRGWANETDDELIVGPRLPEYRTLESAKAWAQRTENIWARSAEKTP